MLLTRLHQRQPAPSAAEGCGNTDPIWHPCRRLFPARVSNLPERNLCRAVGPMGAGTHESRLCRIARLKTREGTSTSMPCLKRLDSASEPSTPRSKNPYLSVLRLWLSG